MVNVDVETQAAKTQLHSSQEASRDGRCATETKEHASRVLIVDQGAPGRSSSELVPLLESRGYQVRFLDSESQGLETLGQTPPDALILAVSRERPAGSSRSGVDLRGAARRLGIPVLDVLDPGTDLGLGSEPSPEADDWVFRGSHADELSMRLTRLLRGRKLASAAAHRSSAIPIDTRFTSLVVHDLRTPLNVIGLSFRMIEQALPRDDPDVAEDMRFIEENFRQMERMLSQLGDYSRLTEPGLSLSVSAFSPRRLVEDLLETRAGRPGGKKPPVQLDVQKTCPEEASLDQVRARLAIDYALVNACAAAHDEPIRLTLRGRPQRWIIEVAIDRPPPSSVESLELQPYMYERLCGAAAERRGMDLAIAARVSELFGGTARLEAVQGQGTAIILDWPARIAVPSARA